MFAFGHQRPSRRPSLTPMIDVVFLLLVFFMLAARFGTDFGLQLNTATRGGTYEGPPRLVDVGAQNVLLNGVETADDRLAPELKALMPDPAATIIIRPGENAQLQRLVDVLEHLKAAGFGSLAVIE